MKVIWGGTFDPVHNGHIELAHQLVKSLSLDKLYLMPCYQAVHKDNVAASPSQRLHMLTLATQRYPQLCIDGREIEKKCVSYTYDSLCDLRQEIGRESLNFVMGTDSLITFSDWYRAQEMHTLTNIIIIQRPDCSFDTDKKNIVSLTDKKLDELCSMGFSPIDMPHNLKNYEFGKFIKLELAQMNISSTHIRSLVKKRKKITHLVNSDVNHFINMHHLYSK